MGKKRVMLSLDQDLVAILKDIKGFGNKDAEKCTNLIRAYLAEKNYLKDLNK
jgi:hypothetical protein